MTPRPNRRKGESLAAHYLRVLEWERIHKRECEARARDIDRALRIPNQRHEKPVSKQTELNRRSMHEFAENNPRLRKILADMQKAGIAI